MSLSKNRIAAALIILLMPASLFCQVLQTSEISETLLPVNTVSVGMDKLLNTYLFSLNSNMDFSLFSGRIQLTENYRGIGLRTGYISFRDDQSWKLEYSYPVSGFFSPFVRQNWLYSNDARAVALNEIDRLNGNAGLRIQDNNLSFFEVSGGIERNKQLGILSTGYLGNLNGNLSSYDLLGVKINSNLAGEFLQLSHKRQNSELDFRLNSVKNYDTLNRINLNFRYKMLNRDFFSPLSNISDNNIPVESRFERRLFADAGIAFAFSHFLQVNLLASYSRANIERAFNTSYNEIPMTKVYRLLDESNLFASGEVKLFFKNYQQTFGYSFMGRDEKNSVSKNHEITQLEELELAQLENQRDNISGRNRLFTSLFYQPFRNDTVRLNYSMSLLKYDTPSNLNRDDRDELSYLGNLMYARRFSDLLSAYINLEMSLLHIVFLKSQRSSSNNWNRIIKLEPGIKYSSNSVKINPRLEVLANYTVYDFSEISPGVRSFSLRQIGYKDSIFIELGDNFNLQTKLLFRYFERGIFYWKSFSETPQNNNIEQFIKMLLFSEMPGGVSIGFGGRFYSLEQRLSGSAGSESTSSNLQQKAYGPEMVIILYLSSRSSMQFHGWYEFQKINGVKREIPNLFVNTTYSL